MHLGISRMRKNFEKGNSLFYAILPYYLAILLMEV